MTDKKPTTREIVNARLKSRYAAEARFKWFGISMAALAIISALVLLISIGIQAAPSMSESRLALKLNLAAEKIDPSGSKDPVSIRANADISGLINDELLKRFPNAEAEGSLDAITEIVTSIATTPLALKISKQPDLIGKQFDVNFAVNDDLDMYFKGGFGKTQAFNNFSDLAIVNRPDGIVEIASMNNGFTGVRSEMLGFVRQASIAKQSEVNILNARLASLKTDAAAKPDDSELASQIFEIEGQISTAQDFVNASQAALKSGQGAVTLSSNMPSLIVYANGGAFLAQTISTDRISAKVLVSANPNAPKLAPKLEILKTAADDRPINDLTIAVGTILKNEGLIKQRPNITLLTRSDSNDAEMAGVMSAIIGSFMTLLVTFSLAVPIGIMAAIYLEEFAPKNAWTDFIEVNINNLAAVPSIVFGLLGFSVFLHFFGLPRSAPIVGGIVLSLMSLPVVIIASRAALKAVPPSIREAALGVGASKVQAVFHHVLPLAVPGMMTGAILAMAHALGETAPLLMIGMVAFIADIPKSITDAATVLPVEVFMWAGRPERAWDAKTSAAIIVLLVFMLIMNAVAIILRRKFERRW